MKQIVFDTSALLAVIEGEAGSQRATELLVDGSVAALISAVNLSEAHAVLIRRGMPQDEAWGLLADFNLDVIAFDEGQVRSAGVLIRQTAKSGLSFGDRACLALGLRQDCPVVTADRAWKQLRLGLKVELIRK